MTRSVNTADLHSQRDGLGDWGWKAGGDQPTAAYVHIPFCRHRCGYCNFSLMANREDLNERFLKALEMEFSELKIPRPVKTLFLGGGTPSILPREPMDRLLRLLGYWLPMNHGGEWSMEANPLDVTESFCRHVRSLGVNRLSIGGQSFQASKLKRLERDHSPDQLVESVRIAMQHFDRVSIDLIFAAPEETLDGWHDDLQRALELGVQHVSTYGLTFEKGARFWECENGKRSSRSLRIWNWSFTSMRLTCYVKTVLSITKFPILPSQGMHANTIKTIGWESRGGHLARAQHDI